MKVNFKLVGVDCAVCASKLETAINKLPFIKSATLNFVDLKLYIETTSDCSFTEQQLEEELQELTSKVLPNVVVKSLNKQNYLDKLKSKSKNNNFKNSNVSLPASHNHVSEEEINKALIEKELNSLPNLTDFAKDDLAEPKHEKYKINWFSFSFIKVYLAIVLFALALTLPVGFWWKFGIYLTAYTIVGYDVVISAITNIFKGKFLDEKFLMSLASIAAFCIKEMPEAVAVMLLYQIGELFQDHAVEKSRTAISEIVNLKSEYANKVVGSEITAVSPEDLSVGDIVLIKVGEKVPTDVKLIKGETNFNTSLITGESMPVFANSGSRVYSGSINLTEPVYAKVESAYSDSTVAKILDLVENNTQNKSKAETFITKFAKFYTPIVVFIAVILFALFPLYGGGVVEAIHKSAVFLVISCPCALVISIPLTYFCGLGVSAKHGLLIKGANVLDNINNLKAICFDKTGTITMGQFKITEIFAEKNEKAMLKCLVYAESISNHPIAKCIVADNKINAKLITNSKEIMGKGIVAEIEGNEILCGNEKLLQDYNVEFNAQNVAGTIIYVAKNNEYLGYVVVSDVIKETSKQAITNLKAYNIQTVMLTGDNKTTAEYVAFEVGLTDFRYSLLPQNKVSEFDDIVDLNKFVGYVGDGVNDAPVLNKAHVGYAMGLNGSDSAIEFADVVVMTDDLNSVTDSIKIAKATRKIATQNIVFCLVIKLAIMVLGVLNLAPMYLAIFADVGVSMLAILNAIRIFLFKFNSNKKQG